MRIVHNVVVLILQPTNVLIEQTITMDFISIAQSTSLRAVQRYLQEDDDFSHLDTTHTSHHDGSLQASDSILDMTKEAAAISATDDYLETTPMLSPSAEAELFLLATNFLLCE